MIESFPSPANAGLLGRRWNLLWIPSTSAEVMQVYVNEEVLSDKERLIY